MKDYILIHESIVDTELWKNTEMNHLYYHILLSINPEETETGRGEKFLQFATSEHGLASQTGIERSKVRRLLKKLVEQGYIELEKTPLQTMITAKQNHLFKIPE